MILGRTGGDKRTIQLVAIPSILALLMVAAAIGLLLFWSAVRTDQLEFDRQGRLVDAVIKAQAIKVATVMEAHTTWIHANAEVRKPKLDLEFIDTALGTYLFNSPGIEETYILNNRNLLLYSMQEGRRAPRAGFDRARTIFSPLVRALRSKMADPQKHLIGNAITPSVIDYAVVHDHPAIVIVKPIIPVGEIVPGKRDLVRANVPNQKPGEEYIFIGVKRMDEKSLLLARLRDEHFYEQIRFSPTADKHGGEGAHLIRSPWSGRSVGYYLWEPFKPGSVVLKDMILPLLIGLAIVGAFTWLLIRRLWRSTAELKASEAQAKHLAFHDVLTGLPNRALFDARLDRALADSRSNTGQNVALLYLDVDRFKAVNDTLGHPAGDELIREIARRLSSAIRETDTVARLGGDEFAIIQIHRGSGDDIRRLCKRIIQSASEPFTLSGSQVSVGVSVGVARAPVDGLDRTELTRKADIALYHAKASGRGRYAIFVEEMDETIQLRQTIEQDLRLALAADGQLQVHYQPLYEAESKAVDGVEALVRWKHPTKGLVSPLTFIPIAEECGLIEELGEWVLKEACTAGRNWPIGTISVNVSAVQLRSRSFVAHVLKILSDTGFDPTRLELEITETALADGVGQCQANLRALRAKGVRIALDDFGTGYSSFGHLRDFPVDRVKIDQSFITEIDGSGSDNAIVQAIVDLARSTGLKITAEGVETVAQSDFLCSVGCDDLQGFLMSQPLPRTEIDRMFHVNPQASSASSPTAPRGMISDAA